MKKIFPVLALTLIFFSLSACREQADKSTFDTVATVNGEEITSEELEYFKGKRRAQVMNDYLEKYSLAYTEDFWTKEFDGTTPGQALFEQALEECVMAKLQFVLMREKGIYPDISYQGLYKKALAYNEENSDKPGVVGIKTVKMETFYKYYLDNGIMELRNILAEDEIKPAANEISNRAAQLKASGQYPDDTGLASIAESLLISEKYDAYTAALRSSAEIIIIQNETV